MPTESQTRQIQLAANEAELLAEIERLRDEVGRLSRRLIEERADRSVQTEVQTVLADLSHAELEEARSMPGRHLRDGRFIPDPQVVGGVSQTPEPGAPRVQVELDQEKSYEFAPGDKSATAFDEFFNAPDPHLEKTRRFLLD